MSVPPAFFPLFWETLQAVPRMPGGREAAGQTKVMPLIALKQYCRYKRRANRSCMHDGHVARSWQQQAARLMHRSTALADRAREVFTMPPRNADTAESSFVCRC